jgi:hypothetical protein
MSVFVNDIQVLLLILMENMGLIDIENYKFDRNGAI